MKLAEVKKAKDVKIGLDELFNALEEHGFQVSFDDFEEDGNTATASWSGEGGGGDVKFTAMPKGVKVEVRGTSHGGHDDDEVLGTYPWQPAKDMAEAIDESMGRFAHDLSEDDDEDD